MVTNKLLQQMIGLTLAVLLLTGCSGAPTEPTLEATPIQLTATPIPPTTTPIPPTATTVPTATAEAQSGLQPLSSAECSDLADAMSQTLGIPGETTKAPFQDHVSQRTGTGCQTTITGTGLDFENVQVVENALRSMIQAQGWYEDFRYGGGGPTGELTGFRQANKLCRLLVGWEPSKDVDCPSDQPIFMCEIPPEQKLYTISLNCVQDTTAAITQLDLEPTRIQFAPGAISAQVENNLTVGGVDRYVLSATAGQEMTLNFSVTSAVVSAEMSTILNIWGADGMLLGSGYVDTTGRVGELPSTQDYYIDVISVAQAPVDYVLEVIIPPAASQPEPEPKHIQFALGAISAQVQGSLTAGGIDRYVLTAMAGQEMTVNLSDSSTGVNAILVIWGVDGTVLISDHADATTWVGELPFTEDYYIDVKSVAQAPVVYVLEVIISPATSGPRKVPPTFQPVLARLESTGVPLMLPSDFPIEEGLPSIHPYVYTVEPGEYEISLDFGSDCQGAGACHYGSLTGKKVDSNEPVGTRNFGFDAERAQKVTLTNDIEGYFIESVCGASCDDAQVFWIYNGFQYMVGVKGGRQSDVLNLANATIINSIR